jgi:hypothetical protein
MESSIAEFLKRQLACELLPTQSNRVLVISSQVLLGKHEEYAIEFIGAPIVNKNAQLQRRAPCFVTTKHNILAEGAMTLPVTPSGGVLFAI